MYNFQKGYLHILLLIFCLLFFGMISFLLFRGINLNKTTKQNVLSAETYEAQTFTKDPLGAITEGINYIDDVKYVPINAEVGEISYEKTFIYPADPDYDAYSTLKPIDSIRVNILPGSDKYVPGVTGEMTIELLKVKNRQMIMRFSGEIENLRPKHIYKISIWCKFPSQSGEAFCSGGGHKGIQADDKGTVIFSNLIGSVSQSYNAAEITKVEESYFPILGLRIIDAYEAGYHGNINDKDPKAYTRYQTTPHCAVAFLACPFSKFSFDGSKLVSDYIPSLPSPSASPDYSKLPVFFSKYVNLIPPQTSTTQKAKGKLLVEVLKNEINNVLLRVSGEILDLEPNKKYDLWMCYPNLLCSGYGLAKDGTFITDSKGNTLVKNIILGGNNFSDNPISTLKITGFGELKSVEFPYLEGKITIETSLPEGRTSCLGVITKACSPNNKDECSIFSSSCLVPKRWVIVEQQQNNSTTDASSMPLASKEIKKDTAVSANVTSLAKEINYEYEAGVRNDNIANYLRNLVKDILSKLSIFR